MSSVVSFLFFFGSQSLVFVDRYGRRTQSRIFLLFSPSWSLIYWPVKPEGLICSVTLEFLKLWLVAKITLTSYYFSLSLSFSSCLSLICVYTHSSQISVKLPSLPKWVHSVVFYTMPCHFIPFYSQQNRTKPNELLLIICDKWVSPQSPKCTEQNNL